MKSKRSPLGSALHLATTVTAVPFKMMRRIYKQTLAFVLQVIINVFQQLLNAVWYGVSVIDSQPLLSPVKTVVDALDKKFNIRTDLAFAKRTLTVLLEGRRYQLLDYNVGDLWEDTVRQHGPRTSIIFEGQKLTFNQLDTLANQLANWFVAQGVRKGDVIALYMENRPEYIAVWLAASKIGALTALINHNLKGKALLHCIKISNCKYIVSGVEVDDHINDIRDTLINELQAKLFVYGGASQHGAEQIDKTLADMPRHFSKKYRKGVRFTDIWGFVYTSGTTGLPKAAVIKHQRFWATGQAFKRIYEITSEDRIYNVLPLYHAAGGMLGVGTMFASGATLLLRRKFSASQFMKEVSENNVTVIQYIGELARYLLAVPESAYDKKHKLRVAIGNGLRPDIWETFQSRFNIPLIGEFYAATEGNANLFNHVELKTGRGRGAVGRAGAIVRAVLGLKLVKFDIEQEVPLRDANGHCIECDVDEPGELIAKIVVGDISKDFSGYYGNKEGTQKKVIRDAFAKGDLWFRTGDLLKSDQQGHFFFVDRIGDTFRWKGENVSTNEVAEMMMTFAGIKEANVYGVEIPGKDGRAGMAAVVMGEEVDLVGLGKHMAKNLPAYAVPLFIRCLPQMEVTGTFKQQKVELRKQGMDPSKVGDVMYMYNAEKQAYESFGQQQYEDIVAGKIRL